MLERLASWNATGISIASAPMFFTKAERSVTAATRTTIVMRWEVRYGPTRCRVTLDDAGTRDGRADEQCRGDDDHDIVAKALEGILEGNDADKDCGEEREESDQIVAKPAPNKEHHHPDDDGEGQCLLKRHGVAR